MGNRGQVTIFIIIAIIIVAIGLLIYSFYPKLTTTFSNEEKNPPAYIQACIEEKIQDTVEKVSIQGGVINPVNSLLYNDTQVEYLCYTEEYYVPCVVQQPMLKTHIEKEIKDEINSDVESCFSSMKGSYEKKGYTVQLTSGEKKVELYPERIVSTFDYSLTLTKGSDTQKYDSFIVVLNNNLYELVSIANNIIEWETLFGDAETTTYMTYYHDLKVEKNLRGNKGKIYVLTNRNTGDKFQFAIRGQIMPAGIVK